MAWPHLEKAQYKHYETGLDVEPSGQEKERETKNILRSDLEADITQTWLYWKQLERITQNSRNWREVVHALCSRKSQGPKLLSM